MREFTPEETENFLASIDRRIASAAAWLETPDGKLVILRSDYKRYWSLPGGIIDADETPLEAVQREVGEEISIDLPLEAFQFRMVVSRVSTEHGLSYQFIFAATITAEQLAAISPQASEIDEWAVVTRDELAAGGERRYAEIIYSWANCESGYAEQTV